MLAELLLWYNFLGPYKTSKDHSFSPYLQKGTTDIKSMDEDNFHSIEKLMEIKINISVAFLELLG